MFCRNKILIRNESLGILNVPCFLSPYKNSVQNTVADPEEVKANRLKIVFIINKWLKLSIWF